MLLYPFRLIVAISTALCVILLLGFLPLTPGWAGGLSCLVLLTGIWVWLFAHRQRQRQLRLTLSVLGEVQ
ncbi:MAG: hypothetical protein ACRCU9_08470, partial [Iodobacter sp.]